MKVRTLFYSKTILHSWPAESQVQFDFRSFFAVTLQDIPVWKEIGSTDTRNAVMQQNSAEWIFNWIMIYYWTLPGTFKPLVEI